MDTALTNNPGNLIRFTDVCGRFGKGWTGPEVALPPGAQHLRLQFVDDRGRKRRAPAPLTRVVVAARDWL